ncbi:hypothetical protein [Brachyspira sp.]|uniref:hypothetical protein n=1 Tax=Brachyspira sp. TaxID=1977261 RepID=UPI003D7C9F3A
MKNLIMFFVLVMVMVFSNYEVSYSQEVETGNFYFLVGTEGNERAIMYLHVVGERAYGSYYTKNQSIYNKYFFNTGDRLSGSFDGRNLKLSYRDDNGKERTITGTLSGDIVFSGKHNSKNVNLSLANTPVNSARIIEEDYDNKFIFNVRALNNIDYYGSSEIAYLDENIIIFKKLISWGYLDTYSINTGKKIEMKDFISNLNDRNLLALLRKKVLEYASNNDDNYDEYNYNDETYYSFDDDEYNNYQFLITPKDIIFCKYYIDRYETVSIYLNFTFEELKPFIKRGSPLDYLFN